MYSIAHVLNFFIFHFFYFLCIITLSIFRGVSPAIFVAEMIRHKNNAPPERQRLDRKLIGLNPRLKICVIRVPLFEYSVESEHPKGVICLQKWNLNRSIIRPQPGSYIFQNHHLFYRHAIPSELVFVLFFILHSSFFILHFSFFIFHVSYFMFHYLKNCFIFAATSHHLTVPQRN